jgi:hypothetical protein
MDRKMKFSRYQRFAAVAAILGTALLGPIVYDKTVQSV